MGRGVPNQSDFAQSDVEKVLRLDPTSLSNCFANADDGAFDPLYKGEQDRLGNFRNYGGVGIYLVFVVKNEDGDYVEGVEVSVRHIDVKDTDSNGEAVFENVDDGTYSYSVNSKKEGDYLSASGDVTIDGESVLEEVLLPFKPYEVTLKIALDQGEWVIYAPLPELVGEGYYEEEDSVTIQAEKETSDMYFRMWIEGEYDYATFSYDDVVTCELTFGFSMPANNKLFSAIYRQLDNPIPFSVEGFTDAGSHRNISGSITLRNSNGDVVETFNPTYIPFEFEHDIYDRYYIEIDLKDDQGDPLHGEYSQDDGGTYNDIPLGGTTPIWGGLDGIKLRLDSPNW